MTTKQEQLLDEMLRLENEKRALHSKLDAIRQKEKNVIKELIADNVSIYRICKHSGLNANIAGAWAKETQKEQK